MPVEDVIDRVYGPHDFRTDPSRVDLYKSVVGADPIQEVPASMAGSMLFVVAPDLLNDPSIGEMAHSVIHGDQSFRWHRPIPADRTLAVSGKVTKVRMRGEVAFTTFEMAAKDDDGPILDGSSLFLMSAGSATGATVDEEDEPSPDSGSTRYLESTGVGNVPENRFSLSRSDLVRYAAVSRDWNPIHWDHQTAIDAGLAGVVVHGLLQSAWMLAVAETATGRPPVSARFRYRSPLRPAIDTSVEGTVQDGSCSLRLIAGGVVHVSADVETT